MKGLQTGLMQRDTTEMKFAGFLQALRHNSPLVFLFCFLITIPAFSILYYNLRYDFFHSNIARETSFFEIEESLSQSVKASFALSGTRAAQEINEQVAVALNLFRQQHCAKSDFITPAPLDLIPYGFVSPRRSLFPGAESNEAFKERSDASLSQQAHTMLLGLGFNIDHEDVCALDVENVANRYSRFDAEDLILIYGASATIYDIHDVAYQNGNINIHIGYHSGSDIPYYSKEFDDLSRTPKNYPRALSERATWGLIRGSSRYPSLQLRAGPAWTGQGGQADFFDPKTIRWPGSVLNMEEYLAEQNINCSHEYDCSEGRLRAGSVSAIRVLGRQDFLNGPASEALTSLYFFENGRDAPLNASYLRYLYFSTVTVTTLGYGDIVPITTRARVSVALHTVLGVLFAGLFLNSLSAKFTYRNT